MGGGYVQPFQDQSTDIIASLARELPSIYSIINKNILPQEQAKAGAALTVAPAEEQLTRRQEGALADIARQTQRGDIANRADILGGEGANLVSTLRGLDEKTNPEYYRTVASGSSALNSLLNSINPNGLDGGELAAIERSVARDNVGTGNLGVDSPTKTISNAMMFGKQGQEFLGTKRNQLTQAIAAASSFMPQARPIDTNAAVFGQPTRQPTGFADTSGRGSSTSDVAKTVYGGATSRMNSSIESSATDPISLGFSI